MQHTAPRFLVSTFAALVLAAAAGAQVCNSGSILLKNDQLPDNPGGPLAVGVVRGLCENEAAMEVFDTTGSVRVESVAICYAAHLGINGVQAVADLEIYDGATVSAQGRWTLGPLVFRLSDNNANMQIQSTAINTYTLPVPVTCTSGKVVIGFRMLFNLASGDCATGYSANFACDLGTCRPGKSVIDAIGHGPIDPATYTGFGVPLCPLYFRGNWVLRACVRPDVSVAWTGNAVPGGFVNLDFIAPGQTGDYCFAMLANSTTPPTQTPWGNIPLAADPIFLLFLGSGRALLFNRGIGIFDQSGHVYDVLRVPPDPGLRGLDLYCAFFTFQFPNLAPFRSISSPSPVIRIH